jgi:hypothetical protein
LKNPRNNAYKQKESFTMTTTTTNQAALIKAITPLMSAKQAAKLAKQEAIIRAGLVLQAAALGSGVKAQVARLAAKQDFSAHLSKQASESKCTAAAAMLDFFVQALSVRTDEAPFVFSGYPTLKNMQAWTATLDAALTAYKAKCAAKAKKPSGLVIERAGHYADSLALVLASKAAALPVTAPVTQTV